VDTRKLVTVETPIASCHALILCHAIGDTDGVATVITDGTPRFREFANATGTVGMMSLS
jgi:hypothetical protein